MKWCIKDTCQTSIYMNVPAGPVSLPVAYRTCINSHNRGQRRATWVAFCCSMQSTRLFHDEVWKWKHFPHSWHFVRGIHRIPLTKGQWCVTNLPKKLPMIWDAMTHSRSQYCDETVTQCRIPHSAKENPQISVKSISTQPKIFMQKLWNTWLPS